MTKQVKIILFSCLYILGILTFFSNHIPILSAIILFTIIVLMLKNILSLKFSLTLCIIFFLGITNSYFHIKYTDNLTSFIDNRITITAKVASIPTNIDTDRTKFYADVSSVIKGNTNYENINAKTLITINDEEKNYKKIKIGDTIKIEGILKAPQISKNPSQFDYAKYLRFKKVFTLFYADNNWTVLHNAENLTGKIISNLNDTRNKILNLHSKNIKSPMIEILGGIIFGDDAVNPDNITKKSFINSGIFHILAASGMNVTLIFGIWFFFAKNLKFNYKFSIITGILLIIFYTCMTGFGPPIIRASLMLTLILIGKLIDRKTPTMALLFMVAFIMLLFSPLMLFDVGFQLSFIITFALIYTAPLLTFNFPNKYFNYFLGACLIPVIAQFFAAPLQLYYFNTFTLYSVFANIAIIPVLSIVSFLGFISSILAIFPLISNKICYFADIILNPLLIYIIKIADFFSSLPYSIIYLKKPSTFQIILYFSIIILVISLLRFRSKYKYFLPTIAILFITFIFTLIPINNNKAEIIFFAVENADSILIKSPHNQYFLIDSGKSPYKSASSQAANITLKYLKDKGIKNIKAYIITHFDSDHAGGTIDLIKNLNIENIYIPPKAEDSQLYYKILDYFKENNTNFYTLSGKLKIYEEKDFSIKILLPDNKQLKTENQKSIITNLEFYNKTALFMGDGDILTYKTLENEFKKNISILKSGHHGALNTINSDMLKNTQVTIISTGKNIYNHPHPKTISILEENNKKYYRTDYHNAIKLVLSPNKITEFCFSPSYKKFIKQN